MSESVKVAGICCSAILCFAFVAIGERELGWTFFGIFNAILELPLIGKGIQKLIR